jgi:hypothetical protein
MWRAVPCCAREELLRNGAEEMQMGSERIIETLYVISEFFIVRFVTSSALLP